MAFLFQPGLVLDGFRIGYVLQGSTEWLSVRHFSTTVACVEALKADNRTIWVTDLCHSADRLDYDTSVRQLQWLALSLCHWTQFCT